jgi:membrane protease YdiL (CAAX protease family)
MVAMLLCSAFRSELDFVRGQLRRELWHSLRLFVALFAVSLAEVLVFLSILFNLTEVVAGSLLHPPWTPVAAAIVSSALFGLYHFTHSPPWNNWAQAGRLFVVWLFVCLAYALTRDAWAAAIIDASFATIGFVRNRVTTLDGTSIVTAVALDILSIIVVVIATGWV